MRLALSCEYAVAIVPGFVRGGRRCRHLAGLDFWTRRRERVECHGGSDQQAPEAHHDRYGDCYFPRISHVRDCREIMVCGNSSPITSR